MTRLPTSKLRSNLATKTSKRWKTNFAMLKTYRHDLRFKVFSVLRTHRPIIVRPLSRASSSHLRTRKRSYRLNCTHWSPKTRRMSTCLTIHLVKDTVIRHCLLSVSRSSSSWNSWNKSSVGPTQRWSQLSRSWTTKMTRLVMPNSL